MPGVVQPTLLYLAGSFSVVSHLDLAGGLSRNATKLSWVCVFVKLKKERHGDGLGGTGGATRTVVHACAGFSL